MTSVCRLRSGSRFPLQSFTPSARRALRASRRPRRPNEPGATPRRPSRSPRSCASTVARSLGPTRTRRSCSPSSPPRASGGCSSAKRSRRSSCTRRKARSTCRTRWRSRSPTRSSRASSLTGKGINVAVYEDGPDSTANLSITAQFLTSPPTTDQHARHTHGIIKNIEANKPHGHAPECNLHSANSMELAAITWAAHTRGCTVISQSFHRDAEQTDSGPVVRRHVQGLAGAPLAVPDDPAGGRERQRARSSSTTRASTASQSQTTTTRPPAMASDSVFRNPASAAQRPGAAGGRGERNGGHDGRADVQRHEHGRAGRRGLHGAACSRPTRRCKSWPEGCRAILLASASKNVTGSTWWTDRSAGVDASDGSGAVDALEGVRIAQNRRSAGSAATRRGWDVGTLRSSDIGANGETTFA